MNKPKEIEGMTWACIGYGILQGAIQDKGYELKIVEKKEEVS